MRFGAYLFAALTGVAIISHLGRAPKRGASRPERAVPNDPQPQAAPAVARAGPQPRTGLLIRLTTLLCGAALGVALVVPVVGVIADTGSEAPIVTELTAIATATTVPTAIPTNTPTPLPTSTSPPQPTNTPTPEPTNTSAPEPTNTPAAAPTNTPLPEPTNTPTAVPTNTPTVVPTNTPTPGPTNTPLPEPTNTSLPEPTAEAKNIPAPESTNTPTAEPTQEAGSSPTYEPTVVPTAVPTVIETPTVAPTPKGMSDAGPEPDPTGTPATNGTATPAVEATTVEDVTATTSTPEATTTPVTDPTVVPESTATREAQPTPTPMEVPAGDVIPTSEGAEHGSGPTAVAPGNAGGPQLDVRYRRRDGTTSRGGADLGSVPVGGGRRILPAAAILTVRSETRWSLSVTASGPLTDPDTGNTLPLDRFQWRLSEYGRWSPFPDGSAVALSRQAPSPDGTMLTFDYSIIILPTDAPGRYATSVDYTISAAP